MIFWKVEKDLFMDGFYAQSINFKHGEKSELNTGYQIQNWWYTSHDYCAQ